MKIHMWFPRCLTCGHEAYWNAATRKYDHYGVNLRHGSVPDKFDKMTAEELRAYAREHYSTISKVYRRRDLIDAMRHQLRKVSETAPQKPQSPKRRTRVARKGSAPSGTS